MFEEFKAVLQNMTPQQMKAKLEALNAVTRLKTLCKARGWAELEVEKMRIIITQRTPEVEELLAALQAGGIAGIKIYSLESENGVE